MGYKPQYPYCSAYKLKLTMKKYLLFIFALISLYSSATDRFHIEDFSITPGDTVQVDILLDNEAAYTAFQSDIYLPEGLSLAKNGDSYVASLTSRKSSSHTFSVVLQPDGALRLLSYSISLGIYSGNEGALVNLSIVAADDFEGSAALVMKNTLFTTPDGVEVAFADETCMVTIAITALPGDVDGDGNVTISDVTALIDYLLSGNASGVNLTAADCDLDGNITISDVTALIDYLLSSSWN